MAIDTNTKILVLGSTGMVGSAHVRHFSSQHLGKLFCPKRAELDLNNQQATLDYFEKIKPDVVIMAAAKVGGIVANNTERADFVHRNLVIQSNVFEAANRSQVERLVFFGSSCIYPKTAPIPIREDSLLTGALEPTNEPYAIAKIAGLKTVESFRRQYNKNWFTFMPTSLYGENDNFHPERSHVIPGLVVRIATAIKNQDPELVVWGSGKPRREFLFVDDLAAATAFILQTDEAPPTLINVGYGTDLSIGELATKLATLMGFKGTVRFDVSKPDGVFQKLLDSSYLLNRGWKPKVSFDDGLAKAIQYYRDGKFRNF